MGLATVVRMNQPAIKIIVARVARGDKGRWVVASVALAQERSWR